MFEGETLCRDIHPAEIVLPGGGVVTRCRVFATSHRVLVYTAEGRDVKLAHELILAEPDSIPRDRATMGRGQLEARLADGAGTAWINRGSGCGCGSMLKVLVPPVGWTARVAA